MLEEDNFDQPFSDAERAAHLHELKTRCIMFLGRAPEKLPREDLIVVVEKLLCEVGQHKKTISDLQATIRVLR